jgi:glycosyltransferase involved in cell wall biosynthesis
MNQLVSILICTYNAENTIEETIKSCLNQTYKNIEILIHDDQSKDNTIDIINKI